MEATGVKAAWRSCTEAPGAPCAMTAGTLTTPTWSAGSWAVAGLCLPQGVATLVRARGRLSWMTWPAQAMSRTCGTAPTEVGCPITVDTRRTQESSAQVSPWHPWDSHLGMDSGQHPGPAPPLCALTPGWGHCGSPLGKTSGTCGMCAGRNDIRLGLRRTPWAVNWDLRWVRPPHIGPWEGVLPCSCPP